MRGAGVVLSDEEGGEAAAGEGIVAGGSSGAAARGRGAGMALSDGCMDAGIGDCVRVCERERQGADSKITGRL